jgi:uncharacterized protein YndB with AHSA1/START domain
LQLTPAKGNQIEKQVFIRAPRSRVWRAITTPSEFGTWFHATVAGDFAPGALVNLGSTYEKAKGVRFFIIVERLEPETLFSWRWHPGMPLPDVDYSKEPTTTVTFRLEDQEDGTLVTVTESGFDSIPATRREGVYKDNEQGWAIQMESLSNYAGQTA